MNLIVVDKCTNYCRYCFASNEMAKGAARASLREEDIPVVLDFIARSGPEFELNVIGGEPFLYPYLPKLLESVLELENVAKICLFTGGIASSRAVEKICTLPTDRLSTLFNMNERKDYRTQREYDLILKNFDLLLSHGVRSTFGYNIYEEDFNGGEILDLCERFGVGQLRWTVAFPELEDNPYTQTLAPSQYASVSNGVAEFLEEAYQRGISAALDCPLPKCFFSNEQVGRIALTQPLTLASLRACGPVIDVTPSLEVFRCYALAEVQRTRLTDFKDFREVVTHYKTMVDSAYAAPQVFEDCATCEFALDRTCYGGCMAHSPKSIGAAQSPGTLTQKLHEHLLSGELAEARSHFQAHEQVLRPQALANYVMSFVAEQEGHAEEAQRFARRSVVNARDGANAKLFAERLRAVLEMPVAAEAARFEV